MEVAAKTYLTAKPTAELFATIATIVLALFVLALVCVFLFDKYKEAAKEPVRSPINIADATRVLVKSNKAEEQIIAQTSQPAFLSLGKSMVNPGEIKPNELYLVNFCPLTGSLGGYISKDGNPGVFNADYYLQKAIKAGIRSFVLPICSYIDDNKTPDRGWPMSGDPAIVARDTVGKIISLNGLSVAEFCTALNKYAYTENGGQAKEPILLFIKQDVGYLPDSIKSENAYAKILSKIGQQLATIPYHSRLTNLGSMGSATGAQNEAAILTHVPLAQLQGKVIIFTDFDTKIGLKRAYSSLLPTLDDFTNFKVQPIITESAGLATGSGARSMKVADISGSKVNWTDQARTIFHTTTQDYPLTPWQPSNSSIVSNALAIGIHMVPIPFLSVPNIVLKPTIDLWKGMAWKVKEKVARYEKPAQIVPAKPSAALNARVSPNLQPGQMSIA